MRRLSDVLNLITPKKLKKKYCPEEEEDLEMSSQFLAKVQVENSILSTIHDHIPPPGGQGGGGQ